MAVVEDESGGGGNGKEVMDFFGVSGDSTGEGCCLCDIFSLSAKFPESERKNL